MNRILLTAFSILPLLTLATASPQTQESQLDQLIAPEIRNGDFYYAIHALAKTEKISTILEIGSSSGEGSTEAFATAIPKNPNHPLLFCMEVSKCRFKKLQKNYAEHPLVRCYNVSSVPLEKFPS